MVLMSAFSDELLRIKVAAEEEKKPKGINTELLKQFAENVGVAGAGYGIGRTSGKIVGEYLLPLLRPGMDERKLKMLSHAAGTLVGLGSYAMMQSIMKGNRMVDEKRRVDE